MNIHPPVWASGVLLSPQQFQQQARLEAWANLCISRLGCVHPWGVQAIGFDLDALRLGKLKATRLCLNMPDGTLIDTDRLDPLPAALDLDRVAGYLDYTLQARLHSGEQVTFGTTLVAEGNVVVRHLRQQGYLPAR